MIPADLERVSFRRRGRARVIRCGRHTSRPTAREVYRSLADEMDAWTRSRP